MRNNSEFLALGIVVSEVLRVDKAQQTSSVAKGEAQGARVSPLAITL